MPGDSYKKCLGELMRWMAYGLARLLSRIARRGRVLGVWLRMPLRLRLRRLARRLGEWSAE